jgi:hypothetical protein
MADDEDLAEHRGVSERKMFAKWVTLSASLPPQRPKKKEEKRPWRS